MGITHFHYKNGKIVDEWRVYDEASLLVQVKLAQMADVKAANLTAYCPSDPPLPNPARCLRAGSFYRQIRPGGKSASAQQQNICNRMQRMFSFRPEPGRGIARREPHHQQRGAR